MNKNKILLSIFLSIFSILSISTYINTIKQKEYIEVKHQQTFDTMQQMIDGKIIFFRKQLAARIRNIIYNNIEFKESIKSNDRDKIEFVMGRLFKLLKKENKYTKTLHLISNENISIYRAHKPEHYGDDLTNARPIVKYVNDKKRAKYGFEAGLHAITYRVDVPISYEDKHYGVLEYSIDPKLFIDDLSSVSNYIESAILIKKDVYKNIIANKELFNQKMVTLSKDYVLLDDNDFFKDLKVDNLSDDNHFEYNNEHYTSFIYNLLTYNGKSEGKILIAINTTADTHRFDSIIKLSLINQFILIFIIFIIVIYAFTYFEMKIKKLTEHEKQNERILHQQSKMASMGEMIGNIAHQWRQPLSLISTVASGIKVQKEYGLFDESTVEESMDAIISQTEHMSETINDFRDFFKSDKEKIAFNLNKVIEQNIKLIETSFKHSSIVINLEEDKEINLNGYQNELTQAMVNILNNSKDQLLKLELQETKIVKIKTKIDKNYAHIMITDNAGGIPEHIIGKIFEPYFTTKHQSQGTGIGLYMTHEIIVKHFNGNIKASNIDFDYEGQTYKGAMFDITLPLA